MTDVIPIQPGPWENESAVVPAEGPRELAEWLTSIEREGASWDESSSRKTAWGEGYAVIVAVRSPGPRPPDDVPAGVTGTARGFASDPAGGGTCGTIRYFMISGDDVRLLAFRATGAVARFAERLGRFLGPTLNPVAERWRVAWRETFVGVEQVAELLGVEPATVERWARDDENFPLPMLERAKGPVYVREEIVEWLEGKGPPRP